MSRGLKILVVDDERSVGVLLGLRLRKLGHEPLLALHPRDALQMLSPDVDAVITDIDMPEMNGLELASAIRELRHDIPIAFCTGSDPENDTVRRAAQIGPVLPKTWTQGQVRTLVAALSHYCERPDRLPLGSSIIPLSDLDAEITDD